MGPQFPPLEALSPVLGREKLPAAVAVPGVAVQEALTRALPWLLGPGPT